MGKIKRFGLILGLLAALFAVMAAGTTPPSYAQTEGRQGLLGVVDCLLASGVAVSCIPTSEVDHNGTLLSELLDALPWANLQPVDDLDSVGPSDLADGDDLMLGDRSDTGAVKRVSLGALESFLESDNPAAGLGQAAVNALIWGSTGQTSAADTFARNRLPLATITQPGAVTAVGQGKIEQLPTVGDVNNAAKIWGFDAAGNYAVIDAPAAGGGGDITAVTAGTGLTGGGNTGAVTLAVANPFTDSDESKLDGIADNANDYDLPRDLAAFSNDLTGLGYVIQQSAVAQHIGPSPPSNAPTAATYTYGSGYIGGQGTSIESRWWYVRVLTADESNLALYELRVGGVDDDPEELSLRVRMDGTDLPTNVRVDRRGTSGTYTYFGVFIPNKPAAETVILVRHDRLTINNVDIPFDLLLDAPPLEQIHPYPASITELPERPWRRGIWYWNDHTGPLPYDGVRDLAITPASGIGLQVVMAALDPKVQEIVFYSPSYTGSNPPASVVAGKATVLIKSGGTTDNIFNRVTVNGQNYTVQTGAVISSGGLQFLIDNLEYADAVTLANHPAGTLSFGARRRNGNFLYAGGNAAQGLIMWDGDEWRLLLTPRATN